MQPVFESVKKISNARTGVIARREREAAGFSLRETARRMRKSPPYLSDLERGKRNWNDALIADFNAAIERDLAKHRAAMRNKPKLAK